MITKLRVAYIDDNPLEAYILKRKAQNVQLTHFCCGKDFMESEEQFDVVVIDLNLDVENGFEVYSKIKNRSLQFIITSGLLLKVDITMDENCVLISKKELHVELKRRGRSLDLKSINTRGYGRMFQSYVGDIILWYRYCWGGFQIQSRKPSIRKTFKSNASRSFKQKIFRCYSRLGKSKGRGKRQVGQRGNDPFLHNAEELRVREQGGSQNSGRDITGSKNTSQPVKKVSVLPLPNYVGREHSNIVRDVQQCRIAYYLPPCNPEGHGVSDKISQGFNCIGGVYRHSYSNPIRS